MKLQTRVKAGSFHEQHNEKQSKSLVVKTGIKAGSSDDEDVRKSGGTQM